MTRKLLHSLSILVLMLFATQGRLLMAQSADGGRSTAQSTPDRSPGRLPIINVRRPLDSTPRSAATATLSPGEHFGTMGPKKSKAYRFRSIDYPGSSGSAATDSNGHIIVGEFGSDTGYARAFYLKGTTYYTVNIPGAVESFFLGVNTPGQMVGSYYDSQSEHGFVYDGKNISTFDVPGSYGTTDATDISDSGVIVGDYFDNFIHQHGFVDNNGSFTTLDFPGASRTFASGINASGAIVGAYIDTAGEHGFLLINGVYSAIDFPLSIDTAAFGVNDEGEITGTFIDANRLTHGFVYSSGAFYQVDVVGAAETYLNRMTKNGTVIGSISDGLNEGHGIVGH